MDTARASAFAVLALVGGASVAHAQDLSRYRNYTLESTLESVIAAGGLRAADVRTIHERPAKVQQLAWRAPYADAESEPLDPVRAIAFSFYNDALFEIVVSYQRDRTTGLTNRDVIESLSATYGSPAVAASRPTALVLEPVVLARWANAGGAVTLLRDPYTAEFQLVLISKSLSTSARAAMQEAVRLDAIDASRREERQRQQDAADDAAAREKTRSTNKEAFRP